MFWNGWNRFYSLTLECGKASFARDDYENVFPEHQSVTRLDVINFPDLVAVDTVIVAMFVRRSRFAAFRIGVVAVCLETGFLTGKVITDAQRVIPTLLNFYVEFGSRRFGKRSPF